MNEAKLYMAAGFEIKKQQRKKNERLFDLFIIHSDR